MNTKHCYLQIAHGNLAQLNTEAKTIS